MLNCQLLVHLDEGVEQLAVNSPPSLGYQVQGSMFPCPRCYSVICACSRGSPQEDRIPRLKDWRAGIQSSVQVLRRFNVQGRRRVRTLSHTENASALHAGRRRDLTLTLPSSLASCT